MEVVLEAIVAARLALLFAHLLLSAFALHSVLMADWRLLFGQISARRLRKLHYFIMRVLLGLWVTGLLLIATDVGIDIEELSHRPKLLIKLICVTVLSLNALIIGLWCFPRLIDRRPVSRFEASSIMVCGGISTCSWLLSAFIGVARPLQQMDFKQLLTFYAVALLVAAATALLCQPLLYNMLRRVSKKVPTTLVQAVMPIPNSRHPIT